MLEPWAIYFSIFALVFLAAQLAQFGLGDILRSRRRTTERFAALDRAGQSRHEIDDLRRRTSRAGRLALVARLDAMLLQSGTQLTLGQVAAIFLAVWLGLVVVLPAPSVLLYKITVSGIGAWILVGGYFRTRRARRMTRFGEQLPDVIDVIVRSLRAGHPLPVSLALVAREMPEPAGPEFAVVVDEVNYGRELSEALEGLRRRVGYPDLRFLVASISIANQTGGNLGEILSRLSKMLRERFRLKRKVRAFSSEGRFSGYTLSGLPVVLFALINLISPSYYQEFWTSPARTTILLISFGLLTIGNLIIYRLVNFKV